VLAAKLRWIVVVHRNAPIELPPFCAGRTARLTRREQSQHRTAGGREGELGPFQRAALGAGREIARY
jgi:hypothetical protein